MFQWLCEYWSHNTTAAVSWKIPPATALLLRIMSHHHRNAGNNCDLFYLLQHLFRLKQPSEYLHLAVGIFPGLRQFTPGFRITAPAAPQWTSLQKDQPFEFPVHHEWNIAEY